MQDTIRHVLDHKSPKVWTVAASDRVGEAAELMLTERIGSVLVLDGDRLVGVLDERDILVEIIATGHEPWLVRVGDLVERRPCLVVHPDQTVTEVIGIMTEERRRHVPVVAGRRIYGVVSLGDLGRWLSEQVAPERLGREPEHAESALH